MVFVQVKDTGSMPFGGLRSLPSSPPPRAVPKGRIPRRHRMAELRARAADRRAFVNTGVAPAPRSDEWAPQEAGDRLRWAASTDVSLGNTTGISKKRRFDAARVRPSSAPARASHIDLALAPLAPRRGRHPVASAAEGILQVMPRPTLERMLASRPGRLVPEWGSTVALPSGEVRCREAFVCEEARLFSEELCPQYAVFAPPEEAAGLRKKNGRCCGRFAKEERTLLWAFC
eukprot:Hpha_TRINITY_DN4632_c0_g1::TRINITY_DN4632_c0_g1_i1::g.97223::m.97223